jgi:hypothetical protein
VLVLELERELPIAPAGAFALISEPDLMNRWSEARIERVAGGDGGHPGSVGALRRVHVTVGRRETVLDEIVERVDAPRSFEYRVFAPDTVRRHRGVISIDEARGGSRIRWRVEIALAAPPLEWIAKAALRPSLERSLDAMVRVAIEGVPDRAPPPLRDLRDEGAAAREVRASAEACLAVQRARADALLSQGDDRGWFARVYEHVTDGQLRAVDEGRFDHPAWVLRLVVAFHALWEDNLRRRLGEVEGDVETHWARAHRIAETSGRDRATTFLRCMRSIRAGMKAHIEDDLPRAIAKVHLASYAGRADLARFRADYFRMGDIFDRAGARIRDVLPRSEWPLRARAIELFTTEAGRRRSMEQSYYPIAMRRREAFERAERIVDVLAR